MLNRRALLRLINASLRVDQPAYARALGRAWLEFWPHDIRVQFALARAYVAEDRPDAALGVLTELVDRDPEHADGQRLLGQLAQAKGLDELAALALGLADALDNQSAGHDSWLQHVSRGRQALVEGDYGTARAEAEQAVVAEQATPLPSLILVQSHWMAGSHELAQPLARAFAERWPNCVAFALCLADCLLHVGGETDAVYWIHTAAALDPASEVVARYWGREHPYVALWPEEPSIAAPGPVPAKVATVLGANLLAASTSRTSGAAAVNGHSAKGATPRRNKQRRKRPRRKPLALQKSPTTPAPETLQGIEADLARVAAQLPEKGHRQGLGLRRRPNTRHHRRPVHVVLTSRHNLTAKYGPESFRQLSALLEELVGAVRQYRRRRALLVFADDPDSLTPYGLEPVDQNNPWQVKLLLHDLNHRLARKGRTIGSLLIVGGDDIVPFHRLPNPTDDVDPDVPSDNPYGALDENYFVPDWPVGRIPAPCSPNAAPLIAALRNAISAHRAPPDRLRFPFNLIRIVAPNWQPGVDARRSFGYSADVWEQASRHVYDIIGRTRDLATSPPAESQELPRRAFGRLDLSYYNLHGLEDSPDWYGQRTSADGAAPLYPLALRPADIANNGRAPRIVLTEACYGAHILDKQSTGQALCLRFLEAGALAVIGSTRLSYGSVTRPLIAADLLGSHFWEALLTGATVGEALHIAKLGFGREMHERQGFLDGEDQKTLISFVLYGDPLIRAPRVLPPRSTAKSVKAARGAAKSIGRAVCTKGSAGDDDSPAAGTDEEARTLTQVKALAARYLPDVESCDVKIHKTQVTCDGRDHECLISQQPASKSVGADPQQKVYTLGNSLALNGCVSHHYAHITVDKRGSIVKVAVTR